MLKYFIFLLSLFAVPLFAEPIDIVYTWVDGADLEWQQIRNAHLLEWQQKLSINPDGASKNRYKNRDELKYSLRSIHCFAPWVNHIYIVTFGQKPKWLKPHPKITVIDHQEIFPNKADLPTFNSHAIEANLHRIPNLSEKYIYFNDDVLLADEIQETDFFTVDGKLRVALSKQKVALPPAIVAPVVAAPVDPLLPPAPVVPPPPPKAYESAWKNMNEFLDKRFKEEPRGKLAHMPFSFKKSLVQKIEKGCGDIFGVVSSHKFRIHTDYTMTNGLIQYYAYYLGEVVLENESYLTMRITDNVKENSRRFKKFSNLKLKFFCVQDETLEDNPVVDQQAAEFFEYCFPFPAPWE